MENKSKSGNRKPEKSKQKKFNNSKNKKDLSPDKDDIDFIMSQIEKEEARRRNSQIAEATNPSLVETLVGQPSPRIEFTLSTHPFKPELFLLGGKHSIDCEYGACRNEDEMEVYDSLFTYDINKGEWTLIKVSGAPPARCDHRAVAVPYNKGELWVFGGKHLLKPIPHNHSRTVIPPVYHYLRDLWVFSMNERKWKRIISFGGPLARSGHGMTHLKKQLFIFGGEYGDQGKIKNYNDLYSFNTLTTTWQKIEISGMPPSIRNRCIMLPVQENKILIYGGCYKEKLKKKCPTACIHDDMFLIKCEENDKSNLRWESRQVQQSGDIPSRRCGATGVLVSPNLAYVFGGAYDEQHFQNSNCLGEKFYNDLYSLDLTNFQWRKVELNEKRQITTRRQRRRLAKKGNNDISEDEISGFQVLQVMAQEEETVAMVKGAFSPLERAFPGIAVKNAILYLFGGTYKVKRFEAVQQFILSDLYSLDCRKLNKWNAIMEDRSHESLYRVEYDEEDEDDEYKYFYDFSDSDDDFCYNQLEICEISSNSKDASS